MSSRLIKITIRFLATCAALFGLWMIYFMFVRELALANPAPNALRIAFSVFDILLGGYFCWVGFLAWFRFSPRAVRHVLTIVALVTFWTISGMLNWAPHVEPYAFLGMAFGCYLVYRVAYFCCRRRLFPDPDVN